MRKSLTQKGMTLIEVVAVIVLIGLIMSIVARSIFGKSEAAKAELNTVRMEQVRQSLETYRLKYNTYPAQLDDLVRPSADLKNSGKLFTKLADEAELLDIWGQPFKYRIDENRRVYSLTTLGSDGVEGGEGPDQDVTMKP